MAGLYLRRVAFRGRHSGAAASEWVLVFARCASPALTTIFQLLWPLARYVRRDESPGSLIRTKQQQSEKRDTLLLAFRSPSAAPPASFKGPLLQKVDWSNVTFAQKWPLLVSLWFPGFDGEPPRFLSLAGVSS